LLRVAYVNGRYVRGNQAMIHIEDRGYQFADGVYEVCEVRGGRLIDDGPKAEMLTSARLSALFESPLEVFERDGYYHAW